MSGIQIFKNDKFGEVRVVEIGGEPLFCLADLCKVLELTNPSSVKSRLDDDQVQLIDLHTLNYNEGMKTNTLANFVNESGFYDVLLQSSSPNVKQFRRWITSEVLPTIRKTGGYVNSEELFINTYLPYADESTKMMFRATLITVGKQNETIRQQQKQIEYKENVIIGLVDDVSLADKRQILNRVVRHNGANYQERWQMLYREFENKYRINLKYQTSRRTKTTLTAIPTMGWSYWGNP